MMTSKQRSDNAQWAIAVGLMSALVTFTVFMVALCVALLCEFILTGGICEVVDDGVASIGGRLCGATSLLAFVVGFGVAAALEWRKLP